MPSPKDTKGPIVKTGPIGIVVPNICKLLNTKGKDKMTGDEKAKSHAVIHTASAAAAGVGAGLAQIPGSDNAVITPIQLTMILRSSLDL